MRSLIILIFVLVLFSVVPLCGQYVFPSGGSDGYHWSAGSVQIITWSKYFMDTTKNVDILLWNADSAMFSVIAENVPVVDEFYVWSIPIDHPVGDLFKVKVIYSDGFLPGFKYISNDFFSIKESVSVFPLFPSSVNRVSRNHNNSYDIYPVPSSGDFTISSSAKFFCVEIYDASGGLVLHRRFDYTNEYQISSDVSILSSGSYTVLVRFMGSFVTRQLVITR